MESTHRTARPEARTEGLDVQSVDNELMVYDVTARQAHCLNDAAARVWGYCDGDTTVDDMVARLAADTGAPADEMVVLFALRQLADRDLLAEPLELPSDVPMSRRQLLIRLGGAAMLVPVVTSILAPTSAAAQSTGNSQSSGSQSGGSQSSGSSSSGSSSGSSGGSSGSST